MRAFLYPYDVCAMDLILRLLARIMSTFLGTAIISCTADTIQQAIINLI